MLIFLTNAALATTEFNKVTQSVQYIIIQSITTHEIVAHSLGAPTPLYFSAPNQELAGRNLQVTCATITQLWADLRTMEDSLRVLSQTILAYMKAEGNSSLIAQLGKAYSQDSKLSDWYTLLLRKTNATFAIPGYISNDAERSALAEDQRKLIFETELGPKQMLSMVVQELNSGTNEEYKMVAQACFQLARAGKLYVKIQSIFNRALADAAAASYQRNMEPENVSRFFSQLKQNIVNDGELKSALESQNVGLFGV